MALPLLYDFSTKTTVDGSELQLEHENIVGKFSGGIVDADINAGAAISLSKLAAKYQYMQVDFRDLSPTVTTYIQSGVVLAGASGDAEWQIESLTWNCSDVGASACQFQVEWGDYNATTGVWSATTTFGPYTIAGPVANLGASKVEFSGGTTALTFGSQPRSLRVKGLVADATATPYTLTFNLRREIQAA